jgi:hypothetical protein
MEESRKLLNDDLAEKKLQSDRGKDRINEETGW